MKVQHVIGADLSKKTIDLACSPLGTHLRINNSVTGFEEMINWLKSQNVGIADCLIVMEHTGLYSHCFEGFLHQKMISYVKLNALSIKRSIGLVRGKTDKVDAIRIAQFGFERKEKLEATVPLSAPVQRLQMLFATRDHLAREKAGLICSVKEYRNIGLSDKDLILRSQLQLISSFEKQVRKLEEEMLAIINEQQQIKTNFELLQTIKGVGRIVALAVIIKTNNFTRFSNARKFACFCGTAPFEHSSGTSIRGRTRVSHLADKSMKCLLDLSAKAAVQYDKELREYYLRRLESGKPKMSTINVVRNKLLYRMFAVVERQTPFTDKFNRAA